MLANKVIFFVLLFAFLALMLLAALAFVLIGRLWLRTFLNGAPVSFLRIIAMRLRGNPAELLIDTYVTLKQSNFPTSIDIVETTYIQSANRIRSSFDLVELVKNQNVKPKETSSKSDR